MVDSRGDWWDALAKVIDDAHLVRGDQLPMLLDEALDGLGMTGELFVADLAQVVLTPLRPGSAPQLSVDATLAGRAFQLSEILAGSDERCPVLWVPVLDGTERIGALRIELPAGADPDDLVLRQRCWSLSGLFGHVIVTKLPYSDTLHHVRRTSPLSVASELLWQLMPPRTYACTNLVVTATLEPYDQIGGDGYDYAVDDHMASFAVFDGVGHDVMAGLTTALALAAVRNTRRRGEASLAAAAANADSLIGQHATDGRFVTAVLARLDTATGHLAYLLAGHPPPLLLRDGKAVKELAAPRRLPLGLRPVRAPVGVGGGEENLEPGDRLLLYTDGITEARDLTGGFFGLDRLVDLAERALSTGLSTPETLRRLTQAVLSHQQGRLQDDATLLLVEWSGHGHEALLPRSVAPPSP